MPIFEAEASKMGTKPSEAKSRRGSGRSATPARGYSYRQSAVCPVAAITLLELPGRRGSRVPDKSANPAMKVCCPALVSAVADGREAALSRNPPSTPEPFGAPENSFARAFRARAR